MGPLRRSLVACCAVTGVFGLTSCAWSPLSSHWPIPPGELAKAFNPLTATTPADEKMSAIESGLGSLIVAAQGAAKGASERDWGSGDVVTAGGLMAVIGGIADKTGLINTGAAAGLAGGAGRARYQYMTQERAYRKAEGALSCIQSQVRQFNDAYRVLVLSAGLPAERLGASKAPSLAIGATNRVLRRLVNELDAVSADAPSRQDLEALAQKFSQAASAPPPTSAPQAASAVRSLSASKRAKLASETPGEPQWLVDDARAVGNAFPAELDTCTL